jgi:surface protein
MQYATFKALCWFSLATWLVFGSTAEAAGARAHVRTFPSAWTACGRLAGVLLCVGVQRKHRRVEHGVRDDVVLCMLPLRRFVGFRWRPGLCAAALPRRRAHARMCVRFHRRGPRAVGSQAFYYASAFNVNIGAWNTASVSNMATVRAVLAVARYASLCNAAKWRAPSAVDDGCRATSVYVHTYSDIIFLGLVIIL